MTEPAAYLGNAWYMAAWADEVGDAMLRRRIAGDPILLFQTPEGKAVALTDRCPHRFAQLSAGTREGDIVRCPYHGLAFDAGGRCVHNPFDEAIPAKAAVRAWPTHEADGIVWLWRGDPAAADPGLAPDFSALTPGGEAPVHDLIPMRAPYQFATDNLMDLSHIEFVHRGSFAGAGVIFAGTHSVRREGDTIHSDWWMPDVPAPSHTFGVYERGMRTDHWLDMRWNAPASMLLEVGSTPTGRAREEGVIAHQAHIITPEGEGSAHYFWATTRSGAPPNEAADDHLRTMMRQAFVGEDKAIIEGAFENLDGQDFWEAKPISRAIDAGAIQARRLLAQMIARESRA